VVVDRIVIKEGIDKRLADSLETVIGLTGGIALVQVIDGEEMIFSQNFACVDCGISIDELSPRMFSFNSPFGACATCDGLGSQMKVDPDLIIPNPSLTIKEGAIAPYANSSEESYYSRMIEALAEHHGVGLNTPMDKMPKTFIEQLLYGTGEEKLTFTYESKYQDGQRTYRAPFEGVVRNLERRYRETASEYIRNEIEEYMSVNSCPDCKGNRLKKESLSVKVGGISISNVTDMSIRELVDFFSRLQLNDRQRFIAHQIMKEINARLGFLMDVGLDYLTLSRAAGTLSGGESQRIRLATQIGSKLVGVLYILDEPSIGLHQRDNERLLKTLRDLTNLGNTLIVVEHDEDTMFAADHIIDIGPGAGSKGGNIIAQGDVKEIMANPESITGQYLSGVRFIEIPEVRRKPNGKWIEVIILANRCSFYISIQFILFQ